MNPEECLSRVPLVKSECARLSKVWRGFSEAQWKTPTFCPGWLAEDPVVHVATGAVFYASSIRRALDGLPPEPPYGKGTKEFYAIRIRKGEELKALPREKMLDAFDAASAKVQAELDRIRPGDFPKAAFHPRGLIPLGAWAGMRLVEVVIHDWDIRYGQDPAAKVAPQGVEGMLTFLPSYQTRFFGWRENPPFSGRFRFRSTGPGREWSLTVSGEAAADSEDVSGDFDAVITADAEAHLLLIYGRAKQDRMEKAGRLTVEGNGDLAGKLLSVLYAKY